MGDGTGLLAFVKTTPLGALYMRSLDKLGFRHWRFELDSESQGERAAMSSLQGVRTPVFFSTSNTTKGFLVLSARKGNEVMRMAHTFHETAF